MAECTISFCNFHETGPTSKDFLNKNGTYVFWFLVEKQFTVPIHLTHKFFVKGCFSSKGQISMMICFNWNLWSCMCTTLVFQCQPPSWIGISNLLKSFIPQCSLHKTFQQTSYNCLLSTHGKMFLQWPHGNSHGYTSCRCCHPVFLTGCHGYIWGSWFEETLMTEEYCKTINSFPCVLIWKCLQIRTC